METFTPVSVNKLYIQIYNQLYDAITSGKYRIGERLPSEKDLCAAFNVSRVPVREALSALELNGLVECMRGAGVYVRRTTPSSGTLAQEVEPQDISRARMILEPDIARMAASQINEEQRTEQNQQRKAADNKLEAVCSLPFAFDCFRLHDDNLCE